MAKPDFSHKRLAKEFETVSAMIELYCQNHHSRSSHGGLCSECKKLKEYACKKLSRCPFQETKPTCAKCTVHCYNRDMRSRIKTIMKYAGPRMVYKHPLMALKHLLDG